MAAGSALGLALVGVLPAGGPAQAAARERPSEVRFRHAVSFAVHQLGRTDARLRDGRFPTVAPDGGFWHTSGTAGWLAGFYPGALWSAYELTGDMRWRRRAEQRQEPLAVRQHDSTSHDLGFLLQTSFGAGATLTGSRADAAVIRRAAATLASRWVPRAAALRSWDGPEGQVTVIVDSLMNLELLFDAARRSGRVDWRDLAVRHALTVAREHVRADGSTFHVVRFDEESGATAWRGTVQGLADSSTWARGHSWAVHGFTTAWRESRDARLLAAARATADFALAHLPADGVPYWDYDAPAAGDRTRDTTAAAALSAGLLELARSDPDPDRRARYTRAGLRSLRSLTGPAYLARGTASPAVLRHGRHNAIYDDVGVTYGDHYVLEALLRVQLLPTTEPVLRARRSGPRAATTADLGSERRVSGVSVRWHDGAARATRFRVATSRDGQNWTVVRGGVSSGRFSGFETYDIADRAVRYVRVSVLGAGGVGRLRVLG